MWKLMEAESEQSKKFRIIDTDTVLQIGAPTTTYAKLWNFLESLLVEYQGPWWRMVAVNSSDASVKWCV